MHTAAAIHGALMSPELQKVAEKVRAGTAAAIDISAANISLVEKKVLAGVVDGTATRQSVMQAPIDPALREIVLFAPSLVLGGVSGAGAVGAVTAA